MRLFLIFALALLVVAAAWLVLPSLLGGGPDPAYENRIISAVRAVQERLKQASPGASDVDAFVYPEIVQEKEDAGEAGLWRLSGIATFTFGGGRRGALPYEAQLESLCPDYRQPGCWDLAALSLDGQPVADDTVVQPAVESLEAQAAAGPIESGIPAPLTLVVGIASPEPEPEEPEEIAAEEIALAEESGGSAETAIPEAGATVESAELPAGTASPPTPAAEATEAAPSPETQVAAVPPSFDAELSGADAVARAQLLLSERGFYRGGVDGLMGAQTRAAIAAYQESLGLVPDGRLTAGLIVELESSSQP